MKLRHAISISLLLLAGLATAQSIPPDKSRRSTFIVDDMRRVELLNQIVPLTLSKEQVKAILPAIEKVREKLRKIMLVEADELVRYEKVAARAVADGLKDPAKNPDPELVREIIGYQRAAAIRRQLAVGEGAEEEMLPMLKRTLNKGQLTVMAKSLTLEFFEPGIQPKEATEDLRLKVFVREVMLDPLTYDLLIKMAK